MRKPEAVHDYTHTLNSREWYNCLSVVVFNDVTFNW